MKQTIEDFKQYVERITMFKQAMAILAFDSNTIAPDGGLEQRAKRSGFFELEIFNMYISETMKQHLDALAPHISSLDDDVKAMYRLCKDKYDSGTKIPPELVKEFAELTEESSKAWENARKNANFAEFAPFLKRLVDLQKKLLEYRADEMPVDGTAYDILLDDYEDDMTTEKYDKFFEGLKAVIVPLIKKVLASEKKIDTSFRNFKVDTSTQRKIAEFIANKVGYDLNCGYIGESEHPFSCGSDSTDARITTNYHEDDFISSLYSVLHECGHAIYEQGASENLVGTYLGEGGTMGMHESQSRFYENVIGRSLPFWQSITNELKELLPDEFSHVTPLMFYEFSNQVKNSFIRIEADELTYCLHVIIRYEIEKMLFSGNCEVDDLPNIWNQKYQEYLDITPTDDAVGVLQDVHWSEGLFGYFPSYALGSAYAAQFLSYMQKDFNLDETILNGDFSKIRSWLREKIHAHGCMYTTEELMKREFGEQLDVKHYAEYLNNKYGKLYGLT